MLTYSFTNKGSDSLYIHLYKCIKNDILQGNLPPGSKLPSKRSFAKNLGISVITIENAYAQLAAEGFIFSMPKKGFFVADVQNRPTEAVLSTENVRISSGRNQYLADFSGNQTGSENFPFSIWSKLVREILNDKQQALLTTPPCGGLIELREAIAGHLKQFRNMNISPEQIVIGAGTEYLYSLLIQLLGHDKIYAVENPGYHKIRQIYKHNQVKCTAVNMDEHGLLISELQHKKPDVVHLSPAHHFPTGITMPISRRYELLAWASECDNRYIIEDEYDSEFRMTGKPIPTMQSIDVMEKVIYMNTFTKSLASTIRISYMVLPPHLINRFYRELSFYSCTVSNFEQYPLCRFIEDGYFEKHINRMRNHYHLKRDLLLDSIKKSPLSSYVTISEENAGLHFLIHVDTEYSDREFCDRALKHGIKISPLSAYYFESESEPSPESHLQPSSVSEHVFIVNYSNVDESVIPEAIKRLYECL